MNNREFNESTAGRDPFSLFKAWFREASEKDPEWHNAMVLSTATPSGKPSSRVVLLKEFTAEGFIFFTNYLSRKGKEISGNPFGSLVFFWPLDYRQVRIEGSIMKTANDVSDKYFASRPRESRIAAAASQQSEIIPGRLQLEEKYNKISNQYKGEKIPRPSSWGGYILLPETFEFWSGRPNRMHDRLRFRKAEKDWVVERLEP